MSMSDDAKPDQGRGTSYAVAFDLFRKKLKTMQLDLATSAPQIHRSVRFNIPKCTHVNLRSDFDCYVLCVRLATSDYRLTRQQWKMLSKPPPDPVDQFLLPLTNGPKQLKAVKEALLRSYHPQYLRTMAALLLDREYDPLGLLHAPENQRELEDYYLKFFCAKEYHATDVALLSVYAEFFEVEGRLRPAREARETVFNMRHTFLGGSNPDTLRAMEDLAVMYYRQGRREYAINWMSRCVEGRRKVLVDEHKDTMRAMRLLAQYIEERDGTWKEDVNTSKQMSWNKTRRPEHRFLDAMERLNQEIHNASQSEDDSAEELSQETLIEPANG